MAEEQLIIPVYLNQRVVFDLIAMMRDGISTVTTVTKSESSREDTVGEVKATFGLSNALSALLKIDLSGGKTIASGGDASQKTSQERVHTPASLFYTLRKILVDKKVIKKDAESIEIQSGDIIEFEAILSRNPIIETVEAMAELIELASVFTDPQKVGKGKQKAEKDDLKKIRKQMLSLTDSLKAGDSIDLTTDNLKSGYQAVITLEIQFLNDPTMSDVIDGKFNVLGKVIRTIESESESISLIRKTAVSKMPSPLLKQTFDALSDLSVEQGFNIPELKWEIKGPVIQVIPIAIFA